MPYVLIHNETGKYVAPGGRESSYTERLEEAEVYATLEAAERNRCIQSEHAVSLNHLTRRPVA